MNKVLSVRYEIFWRQVNYRNDVKLYFETKVLHYETVRARQCNKHRFNFKMIREIVCFVCLAI